jgi:NAD(P)-dependent dehydrogenase (short-subunit alcohol dehydrogenase family)
MAELAKVDELRFDGKVVIVTGGGRGFGRCHALDFARRGASVVVADYGMELDGTGSSPEPVESVVAEIRAAGGEATAVFADCSVESEAQRVVQTAIDTYGTLDVLVNNAGISDPDWFEQQSAERFVRMTNNQYYTTVWMTKAAWPHLQASGGNVVNTASEAILGGVPKAASYCGAKGGVFAFTRALALDGRRLGVRLNAVCPRGNTRLSAPEVLSRHYDQPVEFFQSEWFDGMKPEYVSAAVIAFAHESCELTGETFVCGGSLVMRLATVETQGITGSAGVSAEEILGSLDKIMDMTDATLMTIDRPA